MREGMSPQFEHEGMSQQMVREGMSPRMSRRLDTMESIYSSSVRPVATPEDPAMSDRVPLGGPTSTYIPARVHNDSLHRSYERKAKKT